MNEVLVVPFKLKRSKIVESSIPKWHENQSVVWKKRAISARKRAVLVVETSIRMPLKAHVGDKSLRI